MVKVQFTKDFATRKKDEVIELTSLLANSLFRKKVAKKYVKVRAKKDVSN